MLHCINTRAFTLIELLIVIGIISIISGAVLMLTVGVGRTEERLRTAMEVEESEAWVRALWRGDVLAAQAITVTQPAKNQALPQIPRANAPAAPEVPATRPSQISSSSITIRRADAQGTSTVAYRLGQGKTLQRIAGNSRPETLAHGVDSLAFEPVGQGWRMRWTVVDDAGLGQPRVWRFATLATPLTPEVKQ